MLPTPSTSHVPYDLIYEPAEDSYLFLDTLSSDAEKAWLHSRFSSSSSSPPPSPPSPQQSRTRTDRPRTRTRNENENENRNRSGDGDGRAPLLVEIGPGSGVIVAFLTAHAGTIFGGNVLSLSVDVNPHACLATRTTVEKALAETGTVERAAEENEAEKGGGGGGGDRGPVAVGRRLGRSIYLSSLNGDLASALRPGEVDILVFNPPYVPTDSVPVASSSSPAAAAAATSINSSAAAAAPLSTYSSSSSSPRNPAAGPSFEEQSNLLALSYAGGVDGMEVTNRLLRQIPEVLSPLGVAYVLFCRGNRPEEVKSWIRGWQQPAPGEDSQCQWHAETVGTSGKTAGWEKLEIVRIWRERIPPRGDVEGSLPSPP